MRGFSQDLKAGSLEVVFYGDVKNTDCHSGYNPVLNLGTIEEERGLKEPGREKKLSFAQFFHGFFIDFIEVFILGHRLLQYTVYLGKVVFVNNRICAF